MRGRPWRTPPTPLERDAVNTGMTDHVESALNLLDRAADRAGADVRENVYHVQEGIEAVTTDEETATDPPRAGRLEELAEKLAGLERETEGEVRELLRAARIHVEAVEEDR